MRSETFFKFVINYKEIDKYITKFSTFLYGYTVLLPIKRVK